MVIREDFDVRILPTVRKGRVLVQLLAPITFRDVKIGGERYDIEVPEWYVSDLASIPGPLRGFLPALGTYSYAAILHDYLYEYAPLGCTRREADNAFRSVMRQTEVKRLTRNIIYYGVALGGKRGWDTYRAFN